MLVLIYKNNLDHLLIVKKIKKPYPQPLPRSEGSDMLC